MSALSRIFSVLIMVPLLLSACGVRDGEIAGNEISKNLKISGDFYNSGGSEVYGRWWTVFKSDELNTLMERMFADNYRIAESYEGLKALYASYGISNADRIPTLSLGAGASKSFSEVNGDKVEVNSYSLSLTASYEADIWGKLKYASKSNMYTLMSSRYDLDSLYMTLSAELADRYIAYIAYSKILKKKQEGMSLYKSMLDARERLYRSGIGDMTKLLEAKKSLEAAQTEVLTAEQNLDGVRQSIAVLLGFADGRQISISDDGYITPELPKAVPSEVVSGRPDIRSALYTLYRYDRAAAAAAAKRYPSLSLSASAGYSGDTVSDLISPENFAAQILGNLVLPIIDGRARKLEYEKQQAYLRQNIYTYQKTVITGLNEVQTALNTNRYALETLNRQNDRLDSDMKLYNIAKMRYEMGIDDYESVLETRIALNEREAAVISARSALAQARIELIRAIGGGWTQEYTDKRLQDDIAKLFSGDDK
ncbi:MAG: efflux transporter outer membrane subunit [Deferribacterales bacterium]